MRRLIAAALVVGSAIAGNAIAQAYPARPITIVVPFPPGGVTDNVGRVMAERMKDALGQSVVVENVSGAGGTIGSARVARSTPDGYTLVVGQWTSHVGGGALYTLTYDTVNDFAPVSLLTTAPLWIVGPSKLPAKDLPELIAWLKANPNRASGATTGVGSAAHVCLLDFQNRAGIRIQTVPYRGGAPIMQDLLGGQIELSCLEASQTLPHFRSGKFRAFGVVTKDRWFLAPEVPTMEEGGVAGMQMPFWHGLWAPKGTPADIIAKVNAAVITAFGDPTVQKRFAEMGHDIPSREQLTPAALSAHHKAEVAKWWPIIKAANLKAEGQ
jgi:tripartite-type tricarboxylate transporter receptor subunit TctC